MSYTTGSQTLQKSMNGIFNIDTGGGVIIEGDTITAGTMTADDIVCETLTAHDTVLLGTDTLSTIARVGNEDVFTLNIAKALDPIFRFKFAPAVNSNFAMTLSHRYPITIPNILGYALQIGDQSGALDNSVLRVYQIESTITLATLHVTTPELILGYDGQVSFQVLGSTSGTNIFIFNISPIVYSPVSLPRYQFMFSGVLNVGIEESVTTFKGSTGIAVDNDITAGGIITGASLVLGYDSQVSAYVQSGTNSTNIFVFNIDPIVYSPVSLPRYQFRFSNVVNVRIEESVTTFKGSTGIAVDNAITAGGLITGDSLFSVNNITAGGFFLGTEVHAEDGVYFEVDDRMYAKAALGRLRFINEALTAQSMSFELGITIPLLIEPSLITHSVAGLFQAGCDFTTTLPTSSLTGTPSGTQIAPVNMLNNLYARLTTVANAFTNNNSFNSNLPTSSLTGTPSGTQIAPVNMLNNLYLAAVAGGYARLTLNNTFTNTNLFTAFCPSSQIDPTALDDTGIVNWRTLLAQIASAWTTHKASINTWTASNTFNMNISTLLPVNFTWGSAQTYGANSVGYTLNNQTRVTSLCSGTAGTFVDAASITLPAAYGVFLVEFSCLFSAAASSFSTVAIGTTSLTPLVQSRQVNQTAVVQANYYCRTTCVVANTALSATIYGVAASSVANAPITSVDIRYRRIG